MARTLVDTTFDQSERSTRLWFDRVVSTRLAIELHTGVQCERNAAKRLAQTPSSAFDGHNYAAGMNCNECRGLPA